MIYDVVRERRRDILISVREGKVIVKAPPSIDDERLHEFVNKHRRWIANRIDAERRRNVNEQSLEALGTDRLRREAKEYFNSEVLRFSMIMGLKYNKIKITSAKKRFGSCNSEGTLCFSYMLMLYPRAAREYVIVHELAHLVEMNHSRAFYKVIERVMPDYKIRRKMLK